MFGLFDGIQDSVENILDVGIGIATLGEYGNFSKKSVSKMIADGIEIVVIAKTFDVGIDIVEAMLDGEED